MTRLKRLGIVISLAVLLVLPLAGCYRTAQMAPPAQTPPAQSETASKTADGASGHQLIVVTEKGFAPASVTVKVGTNVIWSNSGKKDHDVVLSSSAKSGAIKPGGTAAHVFKKAGTFTYRDSTDPALTGTVIVTK